MNRILALLLTTFACIVLVPIVAFAISEGNYLVLLMTAAVIICLPLILIPQSLVFLTMVFWLSGFLVPLGGGNLTIFYAMIPLIVAAATARLIYQIPHTFKWNPAYSWLIAFLACFGPVLAVHGIGLRFLGSSSWGGFTYVQIFLSAAFLLFIPLLPTSKAAWKWGLLGLAFMSIFPAIGDTLATFGYLPPIATAFIQTASQIGMSQMALETGQGVVRIYSLSPLALALLIAAYSRMTIRQGFVAHRTLFLLLAGIATIISLPSGNRLFTVQIGAFALLVLWFTKTLDRGVILQLLIAASLGYITLLFAAPHLPSGMQRTISFLPFLDLDVSATGDASDSIRWRIELWREALKTLPDYWLIGKGWVFTGHEIERLGFLQYYDQLAWALLASAYHNGHLSLLLGLGIAGYITGIGVLVAFWIRHSKIQKANWNDPDLQKYHLLFYAYFVIQAATFVTVYGDAIGTFSTMFCTLGFAECIRQSDLAISPVPDNDEDMVSPQFTEEFESTYSA